MSRGRSFLPDVHFSGVNLHDAGPGLLCRDRKLYLPVQTARTQQGRVQDVYTVSGCNHLHTQRQDLVMIPFI